MFKKVYILYSAFCTHPAFYSRSAVCILHSVCILSLVRSLQSAVRSLRFTLTGLFYYDQKSEVYVQPLLGNYSAFFKTTGDMTDFSKKYPLRAYTCKVSFEMH